MKIALTSFLFLLLLLSGCTTVPNIAIEDSQTNQTNIERIQQLEQLSDWKINGKIAFINKNDRQSANILWQQDSVNKTERLNLSTVLGINVLQLERLDDHYLLEVDGEEYQTQDLDLLIYQLTGLNLPTRAMHSWLKGLAFLPSDKIEYNEKNNLPKSLTSNYNNQTWHISYKNYRIFKQHRLAKQLTITQGNLRIKIIIHSWVL